MSIIKDHFLNALLAQAAYAHFQSRRPTKAEAKNALTNADTGDFVSAQADNFLDRYQVIDHQENLSDGFSATVFLDKDTNRYVLSIRGTEPLFNPDILDADADITLYGMAFSQTVSLYNYVQRLITPVAQQAPGDA